MRTFFGRICRIMRIFRIRVEILIMNDYVGVRACQHHAEPERQREEPDENRGVSGGRIHYRAWNS